VTPVIAPDDVGPGWTYSGGVFSAPSSPAAPTKIITTLDFLRLFTASEIVAWNAKKREVAALTVADYANPAKAPLVALEYQETMFAETNTIDTSRSDLQAGLDVLIANGIIASDRKAQVIAGEAP
jgi:hypothetical protein